MSEQKTQKGRPKWPLLVSSGVGLVVGLVVAAIVVVEVMPRLMIVTNPSRLDLKDTVKTIEQNIEEQGWVHSGTRNMNASLEKHGKQLAPRVRVIELCHPDYARSVLKSDRYVSCLMPCSVAVWENDKGNVFVSKMNTGLMGKMFGGNIARIMGGAVARDEHAILQEVLQHQ